MFQFIYDSLSAIWKGLGYSQESAEKDTTLLTSDTTSPTRNNSLSSDEKYTFIKCLLHKQSLLKSSDRGLGLRHVSSKEKYHKDLIDGFTGDALSYSITIDIFKKLVPSIQEIISDEYINIVTFSKDIDGQCRATFNGMTRISIDKDLANKIFDELHSRLLVFIKNNFKGPVHYFMLLDNMDGSLYPRDIGIYSNGKCGRQQVSPIQILKAYEKSKEFDTPEALLHAIEKNILQKPPLSFHHYYTKQSTTAILAILRSIPTLDNINSLTMDDVTENLASSEDAEKWTTTKHNLFFKKNGYVDTFCELLPKVNEDLDCFKRALKNNI